MYTFFQLISRPVIPEQVYLAESGFDKTLHELFVVMRCNRTADHHLCDGEKNEHVHCGKQLSLTCIVSEAPCGT